MVAKPEIDRASPPMWLPVERVWVGGVEVQGIRFRDGAETETTWVVWEDGWGRSLLRDVDVEQFEGRNEER